MRKSIAALAGLMFAAVTPAAALATEGPGSTGVSIRVLPPDGTTDPVDPPAEPDGHRGKPVNHHVDGIQGNVDGLNFETGSDNSDINRNYGVNGDSGAQRDSGVHGDSRAERDSGVHGDSQADRDSAVTGAKPEELPFTGMNGDALLVLALAGAVASLEGAALIVLTRRRFRRSP
ncbi:hypothetical protein GT755_18200 [Herbidospora sp. NEAU-GS84]|uniref:Gram-positive cocci surface proteins LPxTG domain-containing protein n=1 Tax=Herbidospora solisilvae TaxID=2696284 RepID=A0A7C9JVL7_9ACTN|nr:hypothetical protein [Herbidospora solisilvae]NAS23619.1 hypothetical protein [Herbidospora solisilvae]